MTQALVTLFPTTTAALNLTTASANVAIPGGIGPLIRITVSSVVTAVRIGIRTGGSGVTAAIPASGGTAGGTVIPAVAGEYFFAADGAADFIAGITDAGTATITVNRAGD